jgi:hypothetical protein
MHKAHDEDFTAEPLTPHFSPLWLVSPFLPEALASNKLAKVADQFAGQIV